MSQEFIHDDFLLETEFAKTLYHDYAEKMPIYDYHCHLPPEEIHFNQSWENMSQLWLGGDHYKWRAMRTNGVAEEYCTGTAPDKEKFMKWAETMPALICNPLYHWTHLELKRYFGVGELLNPDTAENIWDKCNEMLSGDDFTSRALMTRSQVKLVCTTDDPLDSLSHHQAVAKDSSLKVKVLPTWRPDKAMAVHDPASYNDYINLLEKASGLSIVSYEDLKEALKVRHDHFHNQGCRISDHGLDTAYGELCSEAKAGALFSNIRSGGELSVEEQRLLKSALMVYFGELDYNRDWTQQLHMGALRSCNSKMFKQKGADIGFDSIDDQPVAKALAGYLDQLNVRNALPRTILYNLNPSDNAVYATMLGNFQDGSCAGKIQWGSGWWFLDQKKGMEEQIETLSALGLLSRFVGMLTDSRSFLSYTRHEYFRRILCNMLGHEWKKGLIPNDEKLLGQIVQDISFNNAKNYFKIDLFE
ncbi:MAG: glucuronate isomerase [Planctomycetes bacterium]|nr:glucuronate isomerase [Planctomycetota bacterium]